MKHPESDMQIACIKWFRLQYPRYSKMLFAIPNGGTRIPKEAARMKSEGVLSGVPDLMLAVPSHGYVGAFIELKVKPNKPSREQLEWMEQVSNHGYATHVIYGINEFVEWVNYYLSELTPKGIEYVVCRHYGLRPSDLHVKSQRREISEPRQLVMTLIHETGRGTNNKSASYYNKDHATCTHARKTIKAMIETNAEFRAKVYKILDELQISDFNFKRN